MPPPATTATSCRPLPTRSITAQRARPQPGRASPAPPTGALSRTAVSAMRRCGALFPKASAARKPDRAGGGAPGWTPTGTRPPPRASNAADPVQEDFMNKPLPRTGYADASDAELARLVAGGDPAAFEAVMRRHNRALYRTARAILRDDAEAEDALQEAYLQAYRTLGSYRGEARLSTWLARVVANEALMRLRKDARRSAIVPLRHGLADDEIDQRMEGGMD